LLLALLLAELQCDFWVEIAAVCAGCVWQFGVVAFGANRIIYSPEAMMAATAARSALAGFFCWQHYLLLQESFKITEY
jgi:hypothetical protein